MTTQSPHPAAPPVTIVAVTSPIPSHPDPGIFVETLTSARSRLPGCPVLTLADGVREELEHRREDYENFVRRLALYEDMDDSFELLYFPEHMHQARMLQIGLDYVKTPYILLLEHDAPLVGDIPWQDIIEYMDVSATHVVRFLHEDGVHPEWEHLYGETFAHGPNQTRFRRTRQYSARPHLAKTDWYRDVCSHYFNEQSRTFLEDVLYGPGESGRLGNIVVYLPEGSAKRSTHLNGRGDDPKLPQWDAVRRKTL